MISSKVPSNISIIGPAMIPPISIVGSGSSDENRAGSHGGAYNEVPFDSNDDFDIDDYTGANTSAQDVANDTSGLSPTDYSFLEYLEGLLSSVGAENEINRKFNSAEAALQREWASGETQKNRDWQTEMSNSAYQRAVADLRAAGLNPILAATGSGASSGSVVASSGTGASYNVGGGDTISTLINALANLASSVADFLPSTRITKLFK